MAHSCVSTSAASSLTRNTLLFSSSKPSSSSQTRFLSPPLEAFRSRKIRKLAFDRKNARNSSVKASYSREFWQPNRSSQLGIWSIRDDLQIPSTPYFPAYYAEEGQEPNDQEGPQNVESRLFQQRIVRCAGQVGPEMANNLVAQLLYLDAVDPNKDIIMYVNSPGGSVTDGLAIFDTMRHVRPDVCTICVGLAARGVCLHIVMEAIGVQLPTSVYRPVVSIQGMLREMGGWKRSGPGLLGKGFDVIKGRPDFNQGRRYDGGWWDVLVLNFVVGHHKEKLGLVEPSMPQSHGWVGKGGQNSELLREEIGGECHFDRGLHLLMYVGNCWGAIEVGANMGLVHGEDMNALSLIHCTAISVGEAVVVWEETVVLEKGISGGFGGLICQFMGAFLLCAGTKGKRYSLPSSRILIHQPLGGAQGSQTDIEVQTDEMLFHKANLSGHMARLTGQSLEKIYQDTDRDLFMSAKEAKEYGLIDGIIMNPVKALFNQAVGADQ
ncbi:nuclear encoded CLP protease 5 [Actinidia rufa]|uniref:ATP-dependent Clp protease proteolytic subunit n=1 Tax=Actinidia rufa TaxID=165716 RepID=A0A7J0GSP7_9ERIC|nr:nuclear encoded CLP protease 5 [Actinidia rufa]